MLTCQATVDVHDTHTVSGYRVVQVRLVFSLSHRASDELFYRIPHAQRPKHLAYVELFTPFSSEPASEEHGLYKVSRSVTGSGSRRAEIIPVEDLERSCHLFPDFGPVADRSWTTSTVLEKSKDFYVNIFTDLDTYKLLY